MSFNCGYLLGIIKPNTNATRTSSVTLSLDFIRGASSNVARGLPGTGPVRGGALALYNPENPQILLQYPIQKNFSSNGTVLIPFLYDYSAIPETVGTQSSIYGTRCRCSISGLSSGNGTRIINLLHFSNVGDVARAAPHFKMVAGLEELLGDAATAGRRMAAIANVLSRHAMAGVVVF